MTCGPSKSARLLTAIAQPPDAPFATTNLVAVEKF